jgi:hypothetical protein
MQMNWLLSHSEHLKNLVEAVALACAAFFFIWKTRKGYLFVNLSVGIKLARTPKSNDGANHYLVTVVTLVKGDRASLLLTKIQLIIRSTTGVLENTELDISTGVNGDVMRLTPGESYQFAHYCEIPAHTACAVDAFVQGRTTPSAPIGYWHVSAASVPPAPKPLAAQRQDPGAK